MTLTEQQARRLYDPVEYRVGQDTLNHLCLSAGLYAMGRSTGASIDVAQTIVLNRNRLTPETRDGLLAWARRIRETRRAYDMPDRLEPEWETAVKLLAEPYDHIPDGVLACPSASQTDFLLAAAWRHDAEQADNPDDPAFWVSLFEHLPAGMVDEWWRRTTMRDMIWDGLIPDNEETGGITSRIEGQRFEGDGRWVGFFRLLREQDRQKHPDMWRQS